MSGWTQVSNGTLHYDGLRYRAEVTGKSWRLLDLETREVRSRSWPGEYAAAVYVPDVDLEMRRMGMGLPAMDGVDSCVLEDEE